MKKKRNSNYVVRFAVRMTEASFFLQYGAPRNGHLVTRQAPHSADVSFKRR